VQIVNSCDPAPTVPEHRLSDDVRNTQSAERGTNHPAQIMNAPRWQLSVLLDGAKLLKHQLVQPALGLAEAARRLGPVRRGENVLAALETWQVVQHGDYGIAERHHVHRAGFVPSRWHDPLLGLEIEFWPLRAGCLIESLTGPCQQLVHRAEGITHSERRVPERANFMRV